MIIIFEIIGIGFLIWVTIAGLLYWLIISEGRYRHKKDLEELNKK